MGVPTAIYTICIDARPIVVMSADADASLPDEFARKPELMKLVRQTRAITDSLPEEVRRMSERKDIDDALETWLGEDLSILEHEGSALWNGDRGRLHVREATTDEAEKWHVSRRAAIDAGDQDAGDESWLVFLVSVTSAAAPGKRHKSRI